MTEKTFLNTIQENLNFKKNNYKSSYKIKILSNVTINQIKDILENTFYNIEYSTSIIFGDFDNFVQESDLDHDADLIIIFYDFYYFANKFNAYFEGLNNVASYLENLISEFNIIFNNLKNCKAVVLNSFTEKIFETNQFHSKNSKEFCQNINKYLSNNKPENFTIIDIEGLICDIGKREAVSYRHYHSSKSLYSFVFLSTYVELLKPIIFKNLGKLLKVIVFDCDNTLWGGIVGEVGFQNIQLGPTIKNGYYYCELHNFINYLANKGILICLCSKNNLSDVEEVINEHKYFLIDKNQIIIKKINWESKSKNILEISTELNIGTQNILFVDDSEFEIEQVKNQINDILYFKVPEQIENYFTNFKKYIFQLLPHVTVREDFNKIDQYKTQFLRQNDIINHNNLDSYLASLNICLEIKLNDFQNIDRISQLTQKTNQFNLTTKRYTNSEIRTLMEGRSFIFSVGVSDKFGDIGTTALCIINYFDKVATIDTFLMSCRIIGRNIEYSFLNYILNYLKLKEFQIVKASYIKTTKNIQTKNFFDKSGFKVLYHDDTSSEYILNLNDNFNLLTNTSIKII